MRVQGYPPGDSILPGKPYLTPLLGLWAVGRYDLNLSEQDFWSLTVPKFQALLERHKIDQEWQNYRAALICSILANVYRDPKKKSSPFMPADFMPGETEQKQEPDRMLDIVKDFQAVFEAKKRKKHGR